MRAAMLAAVLAAAPAWAADTARRPDDAVPVGGVDGANFERIFGWAYDPDLGTNAAEVRLEISGVPEPLRVRADRPSPSHPELGSLNHGFEVRLGVDCPMPPDLAAVRVRAVAVDGGPHASPAGDRLVHDGTCDLRYPEPAAVGPPHRVMLVVIDPPLASESFRRLHEVLDLPDPLVATRELITEIQRLSGGRASYTIARVVEPGRWPAEFFGSEERERSYLAQCRAAAALRPERDAGQIDDATYRQRLGAIRVAPLPLDSIVKQLWFWNRFVGRTEPMEEVWIWRPPFASLPAGTMTGDGAYRCIAEPLAEKLDEPVAILSFSSGEPVSDALHTYAHRTRALLIHATGAGGEGVDAACNGDLAQDEPEHELPEVASPRADVTSILFAAPPDASARVNRTAWGGLDDAGGHARWWLARLGASAWPRVVTAAASR